MVSKEASQADQVREMQIPILGEKRIKNIKWCRAYYRKNRLKLLEQKRNYYKANPQKMRDRTKANYRKGREAWIEKQKEYYRKNKEKIKERTKMYRLNNSEKIKAAMSVYYRKNKDKRRAYGSKSNDILRNQTFLAYGNRCSCCYESDRAFLTIEHTNHDGKAHREAIKGTGGLPIYRDLRRRGFPKDGYTILCMNCNWATRLGDECPHVERRSRPIEYCG